MFFWLSIENLGRESNFPFYTSFSPKVHWLWLSLGKRAFWKECKKHSISLGFLGFFGKPELVANEKLLTVS